MAAGWLVDCPGDVPALAALVIAGMRSQGVRRDQLGPLADELDVAHYAARAAARSAAGLPAVADSAAGSSLAENAITTTEAAKVLGVSGRQVRRMLADGRLVGVRLGTSWGVDADSLATVKLDRGAA